MFRVQSYSVFLLGWVLAASVTTITAAVESPAQTNYVVGVDDARVFYHQGGSPTGFDTVPIGTEIKVDSSTGERVFFTYKGKSAYIRMEFLKTKAEFAAEQQQNKTSVEAKRENPADTQKVTKEDSNERRLDNKVEVRQDSGKAATADWQFVPQRSFSVGTDMSWTPNGEYLAVASGVGNVHLYNRHGVLLREIAFQMPTRLGFLPSGKVLAVWSQSQGIVFYDLNGVATGRCKLENMAGFELVPGRDLLLVKAAMKAFVVSPDGLIRGPIANEVSQIRAMPNGLHALVAGHGNLQLVTFDGRPLASLTTSQKSPNDLAVRADGQEAVVSVFVDSNTTEIWVIEVGENTLRFKRKFTVPFYVHAMGYSGENGMFWLKNESSIVQRILFYAGGPDATAELTEKMPESIVCHERTKGKLYVYRRGELSELGVGGAKRTVFSTGNTIGWMTHGGWVKDLPLLWYQEAAIGKSGLYHVKSCVLRPDLSPQTVRTIGVLPYISDGSESLLLSRSPERGNHQVFDATGKLIQSLGENGITASVSDDGRVALQMQIVHKGTASESCASLWKDGICVWQHRTTTKTLCADISADGRLGVIAESGGWPQHSRIMLLDTTGLLLETLMEGDGRIVSVAVSRDGQRVAAVPWQYHDSTKQFLSKLFVWKLSVGRTPRVVEIGKGYPEGIFKSMLFSKDGTRVVLVKPKMKGIHPAMSEPEVGIYDCETGAYHSFPIPVGNTASRPAIDPMNRRLWLYFGQVYVVDLKTQNSATLLTSGDEWLWYTQDGYFDASRRGGKLVAMVKGLEAFTVDQFALRNNRPDIILQRLGMGTPELIEQFHRQYLRRLKRAGLKEEDLKMQVHVPSVRILDTRTEGKDAMVKVQLEDKEQALKRYNVYVNDVPLFGAYGKEVSGNQATIEERVPLTDGQNRIEASCFNTAGAESFRAFTTVEYKGKTEPELYFAGIGVSKYQNSQLNLNFADKDVRDLATTFGAMTNSYRRVHVKALVNEEATKQAVEGVKSFLNEARVDDTVVFFISGHGVHSRGNSPEYYYLTHDTNPTNLEATAVNFDVLEGVLQGIKPRRKLFLMDTCESGELEEGEKATVVAKAQARGLIPRTIRSITVVPAGQAKPQARKWLLQRDRYIFNDLLRRSGAVVFSSCRGEELSYEDQTLQNGFFSREIVQALKNGNADANKDGWITTDELRTYVSKAVAERTGDLQHPTVDRDNLYQEIRLPVATASR